MTDRWSPRPIVRRYEIIASVSDNKITLEAYWSERKWQMTPLVLSMDEEDYEENYDAISYLLDSEDWLNADWRGANGWEGWNSGWQSIDWLYEGDTPQIIKEWADELPRLI